MATYVVGDIHGCFREWIMFKSKIERRDPEAKFILVGDILDKGPNSFEMLQWAMDNIFQDSKYQMVLGNHEEEKLKWLRHVLGEADREEWKSQEVAGKMLSADGYNFFKTCCEKKLTFQQLEKIKAWLESLPFYIEREIQTINGKKKFLVLHNNQKFNEAEFILIHGHVPTILEPCKSAGAVPGKIWFRGNIINVDCGLVYGVSKAKGLYGDLAAVRLEDFQEFYYYNHHIV